MAPAYSLAATMGGMIAAAGDASLFALVALSVVMTFLAVAFARMSARYPNAGSSYAWMEMAFGPDVGAYGAWLAIISTFFAILATAVPAGIYTLELLAPAHAQQPLLVAVVGAVWTLCGAGLLYAGMRPTAFVTAAALLFELLVLAASAVAAAFHAPVHIAASQATKGATTALGLSFFGFMNAMALSIWMTDGWEVSASTSEENVGASTTAGRGGVTGLLVTSAVLLLCMAAYLHLGSVAGFKDHADEALNYVGVLLGGGIWQKLISTAVLISTGASLWTSFLYLSRGVYAMGRNGVLPRVFGTLDHRNEPVWALLSIGAVATVAQLLTAWSPSANDALQLVLSATSVFLGVQFVGAAAASVRFFWKDPQERVGGVLLPLLGALALVTVVAGAIYREPAASRAAALSGLLAGLLFVLAVRIFGRRASGRRLRGASLTNGP